KRQIVDETLMSIYDLEKMFGNLSLPGGRFRANGCLFEERTAIIIPYRNRMKHLLQFLSNVLPKLLRQKVDFTIFVIEQTESAAFNRGMMRNIGFVEAGKSGKFGCFIFNDVDTIIEDDRNIYKCSRSMVRHMLSSTDKDGYWLPYYACMGGIVAFTTDQFQYINGYSNLFFMWGAEDDDLYRRVVEAGYNIERPPDPLAAVTKLKHTEE
ncbi:beta-1,4-galactosyltransferase 6-like, partial [Ylistrum balloti]|uniref:beta-1,4-galactosyltransferase 6-like n=1 Tax=Ylistrum balloti TaxID=509963 RepID=UPI0029057E61